MRHISEMAEDNLYSLAQAVRDDPRFKVQMAHFSPEDFPVLDVLALYFGELDEKFDMCSIWCANPETAWSIGYLIGVAAAWNITLVELVDELQADAAKAAAEAALCASLQQATGHPCSHALGLNHEQMSKAYFAEKQRADALAALVKSQEAQA